MAFPQSAEVARDPLNEAAALHDRALENAGKKQFTQAAKLYEQAQAMLEKSLGSRHPATVAGAQRYQAFRESLMPELRDRLATITNLAEFRDGDFDQAIAEIRELLPLAPLRETSYEQIKDVLLGAGLKAESEIVLRTGLGQFPESRLLRVFLSEVLSGMGRPPEALSILEDAGRRPRPAGLSAAADRQQRAIVLLHIGSVLSAMSGWDGALTAYRQAVAIAPELSEGRIKLGQAYMAGNRLEEAQAEFERAARDGPGNAEAHLSLAEVCLARGQWERAASAAERAIALGASGSRALYLSGTALIRTGRREEGQTRLREFATIEAGLQEVERRYREIDSISLSAIRALREGNGDEAIQKLNQGVLSYPDSSRLHLNLAMTLSRLGRSRMAVEILESMLKRTKDGRFVIHKHLADEYSILGDKESSLRHRRIYLETLEAEFLSLVSQ